MIRLLKLEFKRVLKARRTWIFFGIALFLSVVMAYLPVTFESINYKSESGQDVSLKGLDALEYEKTLQKGITGIITPDKVRFAVEEYQNCLIEYGVEAAYELSDEVYYKRIKPYEVLVSGIREIFANPNTGIAPSILDINLDYIDDYYMHCENWIEQLMKLEQKDKLVIQEIAIEMYKDVKKPYEFYPGISGNSMDYQLLLSLIILLGCTVIVAPIFSADYQNGSHDILRCTRHGSICLGFTKVISAISTCAFLYIFCMTIYICITNSLFGWESTKTSVQMIYSIVNLGDWTIGDLQWTMMFAGLLSILATASFTLFISSKCKHIIVALSIGLITCIAPIIVYAIIPGKIGLWIRSMLPSGGVGIMSSFLFATTDFEFLSIGNFAIWTPFAIIAFAAIEVVLFIGLTVYSYKKYTLH